MCQKTKSLNIVTINPFHNDHFVLGVWISNTCKLLDVCVQSYFILKIVSENSIRLTLQAQYCLCLSTVFHLLSLSLYLLSLLCLVFVFSPLAFSAPCSTVCMLGIGDRADPFTAESQTFPPPNLRPFLCFYLSLSPSIRLSISEGCLYLEFAFLIHSLLNL